jgi:hypothetical protein
MPGNWVRMPGNCRANHRLNGLAVQGESRCAASLPVAPCKDFGLVLEDRVDGRSPEITIYSIVGEDPADASGP